ncbi:MAG: DNA cytosine methyltransferase [Actinomycetes bacterium]
MPALRTIDLFCGAGGLSEGFLQSGFNVGVGLDSDQEAIATLQHNHAGTATICGDVREVSGRDLLATAGFAEADVLIGGPSCQGFSTQGRRGRWASEKDPRNLLYKEFARLAGELRPEWLVMENVTGLLWYERGAFAKKIFAEFERRGYRLEHRILLAADFGVPQLRRRLIIIGTRTKQPIRWPEQTHFGGVRRDTVHLWKERHKRLFPHLSPHLTLWDAISDLPAIPAGGGRPISKYTKKPRTDYQRAMRGEQEELLNHEAPPLPDVHYELIKHVAEGETWREIPVDKLPARFAKIRRTDGTNLFARPERNRPSYTIITQFGNVTTGAYTHPLQDRAFSAREGARIQSFPDGFNFLGPLTSQYRQIGNAVPPLLARCIAESVQRGISGSAQSESSDDPALDVAG